MVASDETINVINVTKQRSLISRCVLRNTSVSGDSSTRGVPLRQTVERWLAIDIVYEDECMGAAVVRLRDRSKPFLARGIPNLKLHFYSCHR